ncbi:MAG TPA: NAD(P)/FAD-dependent oxidoreductase [Steroidobacteraceae bacterium]
MFTRLVRIDALIFGELAAWFRPIFDLIVRIALAQVFLINAMMASLRLQSSGLYTAPVMHFDAFMRPLFKTAPASFMEVVFAALFAAGLFTQLSALALLCLALAGAVSVASDTRLFVCALLMAYGLSGSAFFSVDNLFGGLASSALTIAARMQGAAGWVRGHILAIFDAALRVWLGVSVLHSHFGPAGTETLLAGFPSAAISPAYSWISNLLGVLLVVGLATRYVAIGSLLAVSLDAMMAPFSVAQFYWALILARVVLQGAGPGSLDALIEARLRRHFPELAGQPIFSLEGLPQVVIVGAGFAGIACAKALRHAPVGVTLIDRVNYHVFQPLLYQVATASLSPGDIATPVRSLFREAFNTRVVYGTVTDVDTVCRVVKLDSASIPYDYLVLATGATHGYFGNDAWCRFAPGLKRLEDATEIRRRLLIAFERAELAEDSEERKALLTFLVVGGGPTGVELAGAIAELARLGMHKDFRRFDPCEARIVLVQSAARILPSFPETLAVIAQHSLERLGVEVFTGERVEAIDEQGVTIGGKRLAARTVLWAAGVVASAAGVWLKATCDGMGRIVVGPDLTVPGYREVFAIGDTAASKGWAGQNVPGLANAAKQAGTYAARAIRARIGGTCPSRPFRYRHWGSMAAIGRKSAVVDFGRVRLWGVLAWWLWGLLHVGLLVGARNRLATLVNWFWCYITFRSAIRLITGGDPP